MELDSKFEASGKRRGNLPPNWLFLAYVKKSVDPGSGAIFASTSMRTARVTLPEKQGVNGAPPPSLRLLKRPGAKENTHQMREQYHESRFPPSARHELRVMSLRRHHDLDLPVIGSAQHRAEMKFPALSKVLRMYIPQSEAAGPGVALSSAGLRSYINRNQDVH